MKNYPTAHFDFQHDQQKELERKLKYAKKQISPTSYFFLFLEFEQCQSLQKVRKKAARVCLKKKQEGLRTLQFGMLIFHI